MSFDILEYLNRFHGYGYYGSGPIAPPEAPEIIADPAAPNTLDFPPSSPHDEDPVSLSFRKDFDSLMSMNNNQADKVLGYMLQHQQDYHIKDILLTGQRYGYNTTSIYKLLGETGYYGHSDDPNLKPLYPASPVEMDYQPKVTATNRPGDEPYQRWFWESIKRKPYPYNWPF